MARAQLSGILRAISGTLGNFTFRTTKNGIILADKPAARDTPPTSEQILARGFFSTASKQWQTLTDAQRDGWNAYATTYYTNSATGVAPSGQSIYIKAAWYAQALNTALPTNAPTAAPPPSPTQIVGLSATNDTSINIRVVHSISTLTNYRVRVEITPPLASPARHPQPSDYRGVRGAGAGSFSGLMSASSPYSFSGARFTIPNGARFGCRVLIVSPQAIPGNALETVLTQTIA